MVKKEDLSGIALFEGFGAGELEKMAGYLSLKQYSKDEMIFNENAGGSMLYVVLDGAISINHLIREGEVQNLAILKKGEFFGEISLLDGKPHSAAAVALRDSTVFTLTKEKFELLLKKDSAAGYQLLHCISTALCRLLRQMDEKFIDMVKYVWEFGAKT